MPRPSSSVSRSRDPEIKAYYRSHKPPVWPNKCHCGGRLQFDWPYVGKTCVKCGNLVTFNGSKFLDSTPPITSQPDSAEPKAKKRAARPRNSLRADTAKGKVLQSMEALPETLDNPALA